jgi:hypothetical protein
MRDYACMNSPLSAGSNKKTTSAKKWSLTSKIFTPLSYAGTTQFMFQPTGCYQ